MAQTYDPIQTVTLGSPASSVTFSSISAGYTDLVLVVSTPVSGSNTNGAQLRFNGDSGSHYSATYLIGTGSSAISGRVSNGNVIYGAVIASSDALTEIFHILGYANTTTYKTVLSRYNDAGGYAQLCVGMWRGSSGSSADAITSVQVLFQGNAPAGTTVTLYGIKAA